MAVAVLGDPSPLLAFLLFLSLTNCPPPFLTVSLELIHSTAIGIGVCTRVLWSYTLCVTSPNAPAPPYPAITISHIRSYQGLDTVDANLCYRKVGKVNADCRLRVSKSQWGQLGEQNTSAGVVYMDLAFDQSPLCVLRSASVTISLEEITSSRRAPTDGHRFSRRRRQSEIQLPDPLDLRMTDYYGPKSLSGEPSRVTVKKALNLTPEVNVLGSGGGGVGMNKEKQTSYESRWSFTGRLLPTPPHSAYRTLKWEFHESDPDHQALRRSIFHTAFAFHHDNQSFHMKVEIQGKLHRHRDRLKNRVRQMRFPDPFKQGQGVSEILVHPSSGKKSRSRRLDALAQGLPYAMERENMLQTSVQLPSAQPVSFQDMSAGHGLSMATLPEPQYLSSASTSIPKGNESGTPPPGTNSVDRSSRATAHSRSIVVESSQASSGSASEHSDVPSAAKETVDILSQFPLFLVIVRMFGSFLIFFVGKHQREQKQVQDAKDHDLTRGRSRLLLLPSSEQDTRDDADQTHHVVRTD